jgi:predicted DsbA family dithiol-disulfide isomerase
MHDLLMAQQSGLDRAALEQYASSLGLDMDRFRAALDDRAHRAEIEADTKIAEAAGLGGTPAFAINGYKLSGAQPLSRFKKIVRQALADAK